MAALQGRRAAGGAGLSPHELASLPPQRVKRILANRDSAARSKERKLQYISKLESQVRSPPAAFSACSSDAVNSVES